MTTQASTLKTSITATVVGGLILAAILAVVPRAWSFAKFVVGKLYDVFNFKITTPIWVVILITFAIFYLISKTYRSKNIVTSPKMELEQEYLPDELEIAIIIKMTQFDGKRMTKAEISRLIGASQLRTQNALEHLIKHNIIDEIVDYLNGIFYKLSSNGIEFAVKYNIIKS